MSRTILITGSTGMVGRNAAEKLIERGFNILSPTRSEVDLVDATAVRQYFRSNQIDIVLHAAGLVGGIQANIEKPYSFLSINAQIALNVINASIENGIERLINLGSSCMYPKDCQHELTENLILTGSLEPTNEGYAIAKIMASKLCDYAQSEFGLSYKTLIPCNLYGKYDNFHPVRSHMIPAVIRKVHEALSNNDSVEIWGSGQARREFMFVEDLIDFIIYSIQNYDQLPKLMNVGLGNDYTIKEYYQSIADVVGFKGEFTYNLTKPEGMRRKLCSIQKQNQLGWKPKHSLKQGLEKTYQYFLKYHAV
ncbi:GDP-L-fucose synthase [Schleiferiaceae bacterium]|nr:GDP-L-fucose synthase [Schleiferiaceae bacterium]